MESFLWQKLKPRYNWSAVGLRLKGTKVSGVSVSVGSSPITHNLGFLFSGTAVGSFAGPLNIDAYLDTPSATSLSNCVANVGTVASVTIDPTVNTFSVG